MNIIKTYEELLRELIKTDDRFMVVTAENRAAIRNLPDEIGDRFLDTGISEQTMVGVCAGLALRGRIPVAHALATFLTMRAFEFIRTDVGIANLPVKLVGGFAGILSEANGPTHQAIEDVSLMRGIPNMNVFCPADEEDMLICLPEILKSPKPFYIRYTNLKPVLTHINKYKIGKAEIISRGTDCTILVYGTLFRQAYEAVQILENKGLSVGLINIRTPKPIDENAVIEAAKSSKLLITIEDHFLTGGLYTIICEILTRKKIIVNTLPVAFNERWFKPALLNDVIEFENLSGKKISRKILRELELLK
jgi:transketolase